MNASGVWRRLTVASLVTSLGIVSGMAGVLCCLAAHPRWALTGLAVALTTDRADGWVARRWRQESALGAQLDSLSDVLAFGALPGVLAFRLSHDTALVGVCALGYVLTAAWRLADFHDQGLRWHGRQAYFRGIPTTDVAAWFVVIVSVLRILGAIGDQGVLGGFLVIGGWGMISPIAYPKDGPMSRLLMGLVPLAVLVLWLH
ncbi:MAG: CDP-alcohol phosphatidyltransferase family protein [Firmicutes bacterium]|nr:CDP-alcohol phosphatidyltransferase family protein [Bacillota bacterium]